MARYELREGTSNKFWEIALEGTSFTTTYGKIGTDGQMSLKEWDSEERAKKEHDKLIAEKVKKGYSLVSGEDAGHEPAPAKAPAKPAEKPAPAKSVPKAASSAPIPSSPSSPSSAPIPPVASIASASASDDAGARYFEFEDGKSSKFWEIELVGNGFTTRYGRKGADGQQSLKEYESDSRARAEYEKLVAEKVKKGYVERK
ncbi:WGR domain-containing protein [Pendulispora albinea]|uniref:WGR domain-containing protein n=1 Tax=Pendulispora albinea TaxID=2741071 RepID=A0ABZ2LU86_9BACT